MLKWYLKEGSFLASEEKPMIVCDVPGCTYSEVISSPALTEALVRRARADTLPRTQIISTDGIWALVSIVAAEQGWWSEVIKDKRDRDICPVHAPGYRTLLNLQKERELKKASTKA
jgi:hypothetical protein